MTEAVFRDYRISVDNLGFPDTREMLAAEDQLEVTRKGILFTAQGLYKFLMSQDLRKNVFRDIMLEILVVPENGGIGEVKCFAPKALVDEKDIPKVITYPCTKVVFSSSEDYAYSRKILLSVLSEFCGYREVENH